MHDRVHVAADISPGADISAGSEVRSTDTLLRSEWRECGGLAVLAFVLCAAVVCTGGADERAPAADRAGHDLRPSCGRDTVSTV
jgi:hypothetical protein